VEGELAAFPFRLSSGRFLQPDTYEAMAGQGLLSWLGLGVGDDLTLVIEERPDKPITWRIVGQYAEPDNAGQMLIVSLSSLAHRVERTQPLTYYLKLEPGAETAGLKRYLEPRPDSDINLVLVGQTMPSAIVYLQLAIFGLAGILIGIALINVFNTSMVSVQEKARAIGILKTLGMTPAQVITMVNATAGLLGLIATGVGVPLGLVFTQGLVAMLSSMYGFGEVSTSLGLGYILLLIPAMAAVSMAGSFIPSRWATKTPIVQVLRSE
jgi:putative ABC transport system permease protein